MTNPDKAKRIGLAFLFLLILGTLSGYILDKCFPLNLTERPVSTIVVDKNQIPLRAFADTNGIWRFPARPNQVSPLYLQALLTYEDKWFYYHPGINLLSLARAMFQNLSQGRVVSGGSTLTMQVARILEKDTVRPKSFLSRLGVKFLQMFRALQLEYHLTKDEILGLYLTHAPFGANIEGVRAASYTWLGRDAQELTHAEAALMAVLPQAPSRYRPDRHPEQAENARNKVLDRMSRFGKWTSEDIDAAKLEPVVPFRFANPMGAPLAARRLKKIMPGSEVIHSLLDADLQMHVSGLLKAYMSGLPPKQSGAVLVVNHKTMEMQVYAGSADFLNSTRQGHVDMVQALRSPGSALKPFIYGLAIDEGLIHSHSLLLDVPRFGKPYDPGNFTRGFSGPVTVVEALRDSLNLPAVQVLDVYGPGRFHDQLKNAGARFEFAGPPNLSMALGGVGTTLESLVTLYTALGRGGVAIRSRLKKSDPIRERYLMSPGAAYIIREMMSRPLPGQEGIARLSGQGRLAWKTGTSYGFRDAWAIGLQGDYTVGVWVGRPDGSPSPGQYGGITALPLLSQVMESLDYSSDSYQKPDTVTQEDICWPSGLAAPHIRDRGAGACARNHKAWILDQKIPMTMTGERGLNASLIRSFWVDEDGLRATPSCGGQKKKSVVLWPWQAEPFIPVQWRRAAILPKDSNLCPNLAPISLPRIRIISVSDKSILSLQPGENSRVSIPLRALGGRGRKTWFLNQRALPGAANSQVLSIPMPDPGSYQLAVVDETGSFDKVSFKVIALQTTPPSG